MDSKNTFRKKAIIINGSNGFDAIEIKGCMECDHLKNITPECNCEKVDCNIAPGRFRQWEWYDEIQAERPHFIFSECPLPDWDAVRWHWKKSGSKVKVRASGSKLPVMSIGATSPVSSVRSNRSRKHS